MKNKGTTDEIIRTRNLLRAEQFTEDFMPDAFDDERASTFLNL